MRKRLAYMRAGSAHTSERRRSDGRVIELRGQPLPDGGFVTTFSDVTSHKRTEESLREINETLELRVEERTRQLAAAVCAGRTGEPVEDAFRRRREPRSAAAARRRAAVQRRAAQPRRPGRRSARARRERRQFAGRGRRVAGRTARHLAPRRGWRARRDHRVRRRRPAEFVAEAVRAGGRAARHPARRSSPRGCACAPIRVCSGASCRTSSATRCATRSRAAWCSGARRRAGDEVELQVIDTGPGITPEDRSAIFEEFRRLDQPSPWGEKGLGLGLSICERIAAILDSTLTLESDARARQHFRHSRAARRRGRRGELQRARRTQDRPRPKTASSTRILCVDDDAATLDGLRELLARWGFRVLAVASPEAAHGARRRSRSTSCSRTITCRTGPPGSSC